ncbi:uncharacterized protein PITG_13141 [Phytophthora infestans T30-4]|uniref:Uncharacterized protein n=1 Tax=Phytophthora infestans (strain T30-4) TaxID=403677 RepID=D0NJP1_PHYIT|nr:uncharacterized protein PITG_13141 [Phytophthora infestans T30-4]EEY59977.1 conserved hypothetical protein [Phytophthora infestans T30-4]|eukprot:XP_002900662.1 conserved hypothetical protein [Phytophthora infestans T30-4]
MEANPRPSKGGVEVASPSPRTGDMEATRDSEREATTPTRLTALRSQRSSTSHTRVSPYPERVRTRVRRSPSAAHSEERRQLALVVQPIIKATIGQRDASGVTLDKRTVCGAMFNDIITSLFEKLRSHIKGRAAKTNGEWSLQTTFQEERHKRMQFRFKRHMIESTKTEDAWAQWVKSTRRHTVQLLVYEFDLEITKAQDLQNLKRRAFDLRKPIELVQLRRALCTMRLSNCSNTGGADFKDRQKFGAYPPPVHVANLLNAADLLLEQYILNLNRSSRLALDCVAAAIADNEQHRRDVDAFDTQ